MWPHDTYLINVGITPLYLTSRSYSCYVDVCIGLRMWNIPPYMDYSCVNIKMVMVFPHSQCSLCFPRCDSRHVVGTRRSGRVTAGVFGWIYTLVVLMSWQTLVQAASLGKDMSRYWRMSCFHTYVQTLLYSDNTPFHLLQDNSPIHTSNVVKE